MTIIIDWDYTLFDTEKFKQKLFSCLEDLGIEKDLFVITYEKTVCRSEESHDYDLDWQLIQINSLKKINIDRAKKKIKEVLNGSSNYLYGDSLWFLAKLKDKEKHLDLITHGNPNWQKAKVDASGVRRYFDKIYFAKEKKEKFFPKLRFDWSKVFFINDRAEENKILKNLFPALKIIRLRRPQSKYSDTAGEINIPEFVNLQEVYSFLF